MKQFSFIITQIWRVTFKLLVTQSEYTTLPCLNNLILTHVLRDFSNLFNCIYMVWSEIDRGTGLVFLVLTQNFCNNHRIPDFCWTYIAKFIAIENLFDHNSSGNTCDSEMTAMGLSTKSVNKSVIKKNNSK